MSAVASPSPLILVAEDDSDILEMLELSLTAHHMEVLRARHGGEALAILRSATRLPQLILLDLRMRIMDGKQFLTEQQADPRLAGIPVVMMTAMVASEQQAADLKVAGWLSKPIRLKDLYETIAYVLGNERSGDPS